MSYKNGTGLEMSIALSKCQFATEYININSLADHNLWSTVKPVITKPTAYSEISRANLVRSLRTLKLGNGALKTIRNCGLCFRGSIQTILSSCIGELRLVISDNRVNQKRIAKSE